LQELEQAILKHDPSLASPSPSPARRAPRLRRSRWKLAAACGAVIVVAGGAAAAQLASRDTVQFESLKPGLVLIDVRAHRVIKQWPGRSFDYPWVTTGNGRFWVASFNQPFTELDPRTGRVVRQMFPPFASGTNLALPRGRSIWFTGVDGLARYNLSIGKETARYRIMRGTHRFGLYGIAEGGGSIWVASQEENDVDRVEPATGRVLARIPVRAPDWLDYGSGSLWATSDVDGVERIDPGTNTVAAVACVPEPIFRVVAGGGFAWATNPQKGSTYKIDPSGRVVATYTTGDGAQEPTYSDGRLWVSNKDAATLTSIDAATARRARIASVTRSAPRARSAATCWSRCWISRRRISWSRRSTATSRS
jgi:hypothetical protein